jgi:predicted MFS family arabinose efflux permease
MLVIMALLAYVFILPTLLNGLVGLPFMAKLVVCALLLVPLGFAMGIPFPTGLQALTGTQPRVVETAGDANVVEWAWAMNAGSSVLGSVLAMVIAIQYGLNATLACGAFAYLVALLLTKTLRERTAV